MDQTSTPLSAPQAAKCETTIYANYHSIITGVDRAWTYGGFPLPDGTFWLYREPEAIVVVEGDRLRVSARLSRSHDQIQILDNAKNMFFSTRTFAPPEHGSISFEWEQKARCMGTASADLYDGFISVNLLDFTTGAALDFFICNDVISTVYALLPFPGLSLLPRKAQDDRPGYFCDFDELPLPSTSGQLHRYGISYHRGKDEVAYRVDGNEVARYCDVPLKLNGFLIALGLMTEKTIENGKSVSVHGQMLTGEWGAFTITTTEA
ncbi:MAG TPA: DUF6081 family protein [Ktedonobacteraceae bacterium]|jgi:hypothetical protein